VGVLDDAFPHCEGEVQAAKGRVAVLKPGDDAQRVQVVIEGHPVGAQGLVQSLFAGVSEGRVANVVHQRQRFGQLPIQTQRGGQGAGDLGHFQRVREPAAEVVAGRIAGHARKHLGLSCQAAKGAGMQNAGSIADKGRAIGMRRLRPGAARQFAVFAARDGDAGGQCKGRSGLEVDHRCATAAYVWLYRSWGRRC